MKYRVTALTPLLVGGGEKLSPIDYMVYKDQVSVLDQNKIFRLLAKGPRLENYLTQLKRAEKLDFASWGGFAQNFASHRIAFEHPTAAQAWEQARGLDLFIPTFHAGASGPYIPASALKGALRTGYVFSHASEQMLTAAAVHLSGERPNFRRVSEETEHRTAGNGSQSRMRSILIGDSAAAPRQGFKVYLVKTAKLEERGGKFSVGWKPAPVFAEMASPGTIFEGTYGGHVERLSDPELLKMLRWKEPATLKTMAEGANAFARQLLGTEAIFAERAGLAQLAKCIEELQAKLETADQEAGECLMPLGWGGGFLSKTAFGKTENEQYRKLLRLVPFYQKAMASGLPFPKTRRIVHCNGQPASLAGWVKLQLLD